jgi:biotin carboxyl carrier protein
MTLDDDDVREILRLIDESELDELRIDTPELQLHVRRGKQPLPAEPEPPAVVPPVGELHTIASPMLGVFYRASAPGAAPYIDVGTRVEPETVVCLIEVMKMMNSIVAGIAGTIVEICAANAELVEFGQALFRVEVRSEVD